jgi:hypothetical protein
VIGRRPTILRDCLINKGSPYLKGKSFKMDKSIDWQFPHVVFRSNEGSYKFAISVSFLRFPLLEGAYVSQQGLQPIHLDLSEKECRRLFQYFCHCSRWTLGIVGHQKVSQEIDEIKTLCGKLGEDSEGTLCMETITGVIVEYIDFNPLTDRTDDPSTSWMIASLRVILVSLPQ